MSKIKELFNYSDSVVHRHGFEVGVKFEASAAWKLFRCRAEENNGRFSRLLHAIKLLSSGDHSIREVSYLTGYAKNTIWQLMHKIRATRQREGLGEICCPCGKPIVNHRGWCWFRVGNSEARQKLIHSWHYRKTPVKNTGIKSQKKSK